MLVLTTASLRAAAALHPDGVWDSRRFRPNVLLDVEDEGWLEDQWLDQALHIGGVTLVPVQGCVRCTMVTRRQPGLDHDVEIFRTLSRHHGGLFGVWCDIVSPGVVRVGDQAFVAGHALDVDSDHAPTG